MHCGLLSLKAPRVGLEPTTYRLTADRSTIELTGNELSPSSSRHSVSRNLADQRHKTYWCFSALEDRTRAGLGQVPHLRSVRGCSSGSFDGLSALCLVPSTLSDMWLLRSHYNRQSSVRARTSPKVHPHAQCWLSRDCLPSISTPPRLRRVAHFLPEHGP